MQSLIHEIGRRISSQTIATSTDNILLEKMQNSGSVNPVSGGQLGTAPSWNSLGVAAGVTISKPQTTQNSSSGSMSLPHSGTQSTPITLRQPKAEGIHRFL